jgi:4-aminobutyrate aminotransferase-like enzyme
LIFFLFLHVGPRTLAMREEISAAQNTSATVTLVTDMERSRGSYLVDADGNTFLDCFMQIASMPIGEIIQLYDQASLMTLLSGPINSL